MTIITANKAEIPSLGLGTWTLRGNECAEMVRAAIELGYRHIDTAAMYENEQAVGEGIAASGISRESLFVTTKVWFTDIASGALERSAEASLARLGLDQVDLLLIHWPSKTIPLGESIAALNNAAANGLTRHIGVSNFTPAMLDAAMALSDAPLVCNQVEYHPYLDQRAVLAACRRHGMAMVAYCPLARGGKLFSEPAIADAARARDKTPAQIVLRWHVQQPGVAAIPRTTRPERLGENFGVFDFTLEPDDMAAIAALSDRNERICDYDFSPDWNG